MRVHQWHVGIVVDQVVAFWKQRVAVVWEVIFQDGIIESACCWIRDGMVWGQPLGLQCCKKKYS